jgi:hypothetical protein
MRSLKSASRFVVLELLKLLGNPSSIDCMASNSRIIGERIWKEAAAVWSRYYPGIYVYELMKITKVCNQFFRFSRMRFEPNPSGI